LQVKLENNSQIFFNMTSKEFIISNLNFIRILFSELTFKYKFYEENSTHVIEVQPVESFENDTDYIEVETNLTIEFDKLYSPESILFVSDNSLSKIKEPEFVFSSNELGIEVEPIEESNFKQICNSENNEIFDFSEPNYAIAA